MMLFFSMDFELCLLRYPKSSYELFAVYLYHRSTSIKSKQELVKEAQVHTKTTLDILIRVTFAMTLGGGIL